jgi:hypothetical protein
MRLFVAGREEGSYNGYYVDLHSTATSVELQHIISTWFRSHLQHLAAPTPSLEDHRQVPLRISVDAVWVGW